jgi:serine/threonine-protein kinase RsbW
LKIIRKKIFNSIPEILPEVEQFIFKTIKSNIKINKEVQNQIELAVAEAAANSIIHGNQSNPHKKIKVEISFQKKNIKISFQDEGNGFNPGEVPDPTKPENILKGSGRGIHIMKSLADEVIYKFLKTGTKLVLIFKIN